MSNGRTRQQDRAAGPDSVDQLLTLREAEYALVHRLLVIMQAVRRLRTVMQTVYQPWARELLDVERMLQELINDIEHVRIDLSRGR